MPATSTKVARLFVGVRIPDRIRQGLQSELSAFPKLIERVVPEERWHLTLFYLGEVANHTWYLRRLCEELPQSYVPTISLTHIGRGLQRRQLWAFAHDTEVLKNVHDDVRRRVIKLRIPIAAALKQEREFVPHVHLADLYPLTRGIGMADVPVRLTFPFNEIHVFSSEQTEKGLSYRSVGTVQMAPGRSRK